MSDPGEKMLEATPQVSVIIPTYNQSKYLFSAIKSVLAQTFADFEIIVIDDGSTDETSRVAIQFKNHIQYIYQENQGLAGARNTGIHSARGNFVALLDSDDLWLPIFLEKMMRIVSQYPDGTVYYCCARCIDANGNELPQVLGSLTGNPDNLYQVLLRANFLIPSTILMRRSLVEDIGPFDITFRRLQDWELWLRLLKEGNKFYSTKEELVFYRIHNSALSLDPIGGQRAALALANKHFGPDDGHYENWLNDKRRAYGGVYRYYVLTCAQHQNDWQNCALYLRCALQADPTLSIDLNFFYDLALGNQPPGYRGSINFLNLEDNASHIIQLLDFIYSSMDSSEIRSTQLEAYGTAYTALGLVGYNTAQRALCRKYLLKAIYHQPSLILNSLVIGDLLKSIVGPSTVDKLKGYKEKFRF